jgi:hypothetical protein
MDNKTHDSRPTTFSHFFDLFIQRLYRLFLMKLSEDNVTNLPKFQFAYRLKIEDAYQQRPCINAFPGWLFKFS